MLSATQPVTVREIEIESAVTYKTALQLGKRICAVLRTYRGHNKGFGRKVEAYITSKRPQSSEGMTNWSKKSKELLHGETSAPKATGLLSGFTRVQGRVENLERTERLLRLLIAAPKRQKRSRLKTGHGPGSHTALVSPAAAGVKQR